MSFPQRHKIRLSLQSRPLAALCLSLVAFVSAALSQSVTQSVTMTITVAGRNLATSAPAQVRGSRLLIPVVAVATELGYAINVDTAAETVVVRRSGIDASFTKQTAEIRENGNVTAVLSGMADISFPPNKSDLLLPIEAVAPLLAVSITIDREHGIIRIEPETASSTVTNDLPRDRVEISRADYNYGVNVIAGQMSQNLN